MPNKLFLFIALMSGYYCPAQAQIKLTGNIKMSTGESFPYRLELSEAGGIVKGYSYTYAEPNDTKTAITGKLDRVRKTLVFKETDIIYSHDVRTKAYMCLVDARTEYLQGPNGRILTGTATGSEADKTTCTGGVVTFDKQDELKLLFEERNQFDTVITMGRRPKLKPEPVAESHVAEAVQETVRITVGTEKAYNWHSDTVIIDIWEGGTTDGDQVTLAYNGITCLEHYTLTKQGRRIKIPLSGKGMDVLTIMADNEGWDPPNTATLTLRDGNIKYNVVSYNNKGQVSVIKIKPVF